MLDMRHGEEEWRRKGAETRGRIDADQPQHRALRLSRGGASNLVMPEIKNVKPSRSCR